MKATVSVFGIVLSWATCASGFQGIPQSRRWAVPGGPRGHGFAASDDGDSDFPPSEEEYSGSVDWDAEWKKVVSSEEDGVNRPGKDYYKSEAEIAAIKAINKASEKAADVGSSLGNAMPGIPSIGSLSGDWKVRGAGSKRRRPFGRDGDHGCSLAPASAKFWIGILAVVSIGLAVISAPSADIDPSISYYI